MDDNQASLKELRKKQKILKRQKRLARRAEKIKKIKSRITSFGRFLYSGVQFTQTHYKFFIVSIGLYQVQTTKKEIQKIKLLLFNIFETSDIRS